MSSSKSTYGDTSTLCMKLVEVGVNRYLNDVKVFQAFKTISSFGLGSGVLKRMRLRSVYSGFKLCMEGHFGARRIRGEPEEADLWSCRVYF